LSSFRRGAALTLAVLAAAVVGMIATAGPAGAAATAPMVVAAHVSSTDLSPGFCVGGRAAATRCPEEPIDRCTTPTTVASTTVDSVSTRAFFYRIRYQVSYCSTLVGIKLQSMSRTVLAAAIETDPQRTGPTFVALFEAILRQDQIAVNAGTVVVTFLEKVNLCDFVSTGVSGAQIFNRFADEYPFAQFTVSRGAAPVVRSGVSPGPFIP
jgi:hypothetical protein